MGNYTHTSIFFLRYTAFKTEKRSNAFCIGVEIWEILHLPPGDATLTYRSAQRWESIAWKNSLRPASRDRSFWRAMPRRERAIACASWPLRRTLNQRREWSTWAISSDRGPS